MWKVLTVFMFIAWMPVYGQMQRTLQPGTIVPQIKCNADSSQSYALYLPSGYTTNQLWPVVFFFEPAARALLPLNKYHRIAETYGYIMVCSYNSRNGPNEPIFQAANAMYNDVFERFTPDKNRVCLAGFSGGARISCLIAMDNPDVASVIGCGAGFPYSRIPEKPPTFDYLGIIGEQDMNFQELMTLDSVLDHFPGEHMVVTFDRGHQWPDSATFLTAFYWLETCAVRKGLKKEDTALLMAIRKDCASKIKRAKISGTAVDEARILINHLLLLRDLDPAPELQSTYDSLIATPEYLREKQKADSIKSFEVSSHKKYIAEFEQISLLGIDPNHPVKGEDWWRSEFLKIEALEDTNLRARLREFLINGSWEQHHNSLRSNRYDVALGYLEIFEAGLPDSPTPPLLKAKVYALEGNRRAMYRCLEASVENGLTDPDLITEEPVFIPYNNQAKFQQTLLKIHPK